MRLNRYLKSMLAILALGAGMSAPTLAQDSYPSKPLLFVKTVDTEKFFSLVLYFL